MLELYQKQNFTNQRSLEVSRDLIRVFKRRRTIRRFDTQMPDQEVIENAIKIASLAPSGANKQPWSFALVSNQELKQSIRQQAEKEEKHFYQGQGNTSWKKDLESLHTDHQKAFLTEAPYLIIIFFKLYETNNGIKVANTYYAKESAGVATGMLISALHMSGLSTLTYTPSRMQFLTKLFARPKGEKPFMVLATGQPHSEAQVPVITKKTINDVLMTYT